MIKLRLPIPIRRRRNFPHFRKPRSLCVMISYSHIRRDPDGTLVTFIIGTGINEKKFQAHKEFACHCSPVLNAAFNGNSQEARTQTYRLKDISENTFRRLMMWIYSQKVDFDDDEDSNRDEASNVCTDDEADEDYKPQRAEEDVEIEDDIEEDSDEEDGREEDGDEENNDVGYFESSMESESESASELDITASTPDNSENENEVAIKLENAQEDPETQGTMSNTLKKPDENQLIIRRLLEFWILADKLLIPVLQNKILDALAAIETLPVDVLPCVQYVYDNTPEGSPLRRFLVEQIAWHVRPQAYAATPDLFPHAACIDLMTAMSNVLYSERTEPYGLVEYYFDEEDDYDHDEELFRQIRSRK